MSFGLWNKQHTVGATAAPLLVVVYDVLKATMPAAHNKDESVPPERAIPLHIDN